MLELLRVSKSYRRPHETITALDDVSLRVGAGEFVAVQGPSGCGKTTLLLIAGGLLRPDRGTALVGDQNLYDLSDEARARFRAAHVGFVFQQFHLVPYLSVLDNVLSPALARAADGGRQRAEELLRRFGLWPRRTHVPAELSTGERQRTALARALLHRPRLLLADEPTGNLDAENAQLVLEHLRACAHEGAAVLLVTHDPAAASQADRTVFLSARAETIAAGTGS
jgi:ABC-type lipoprotein export system ATPase subunit